MPGQWVVADSGETVGELSRRLEFAHDQVVEHHASAHGIRRVVMDSWERSLRLNLDPSTAGPDVPFDTGDLREYRDAHPLSVIVPVVHRLLVRHAADAGLIVAVGDAGGRLLWIDGDRAMKRRAEEMLFIEGADWSESRVGTSAPGTALALDHGIQIQRAEHFTRIVHPWSCTAVPLHDPESGRVLGVIDITGGDEAVAPHTLPLIEAAVAAAEAELRISRLTSIRDRPRRSAPARPARPSPPSLHVLGRGHAVVETNGHSIELSPRHSEILALLAWHPAGLSAESLSAMLSESPTTAVTLRAEMVRLRRILEPLAPHLVPQSKPYRLVVPLDLDAQRVLAFLERGAHRVALGAYSGQVLPASNAPGIRLIRDEVAARLRDAVLTDASVDTLLTYARTDAAAYDLEVWMTCLRLLPARSPKRAAVVSRIEQIEQELA